ncbi:hypothetical protein T02_1377 [Trichinella nativa]|uniref:Uncharacterized protein n=1 Tax=Trichinella nativa TaxID=6335 RepID=A0A0V1KL67_9BILA|nr:hypothetical protein T02_1377 [Trichinella nativa]
MLCMLLYLYGEWKLTGFFSIVVHQMLKTKEFFVVGYSASSATLLSLHFTLYYFIFVTAALILNYHVYDIIDLVALIQFFYELNLLLNRMNRQSNCQSNEVAGIAFKKRITKNNTRRWAYQIYITSSPELLWSFICSGHRDKSCSDHFVLNVASVSIEFVPDCSCIYFKVLIYFIHDSITLTSSEYDISSDDAVTILLSQSSSVRTNPDNVLVLVAVSAFRM